MGGHESDDRDTFAFEGEAGEVTTVVVEKDLSDGHKGDPARLRSLTPGKDVLSKRMGDLPLEVEATLPESGTFEVVVEEAADLRRGRGEPFRGTYLLSVAIDGGAEDLLLEPRPDVEP